MDAGDDQDEWAALLAAPWASPGPPPPGPSPGPSPGASQATDQGGAPKALHALFAPLFATASGADGCFVVGRLAQTLDGRIATRNGASQWIGGQADLRHTHRLRALCHAVLVGGGTAAADNPLLTTRLVPGPNPVRVVLDTDSRLPVTLKLFQGGPPTLLVVAAETPHGSHFGSAEVLAVRRDAAGALDLAALLTALAARGLTRIFVEGGGITVSRFLMAGLLDRLHVTVAPIILGSGRPAFALPEALCIADGLRFSWTCHDLAPDVLFDIALGRARPPTPSGAQAPAPAGAQAPVPAGLRASLSASASASTSRAGAPPPTSVPTPAGASVPPPTGASVPTPAGASAEVTP